jgi:hypothetical protein
MHETFFVEAKQRAKSFVHSLFKETEALASKEMKIPVLALHQSNGKTVLIVVDKDDLIEFSKAFLESKGFIIGTQT